MNFCCLMPKSPMGKKDGANPCNSQQMKFFNKIIGLEETKKKIEELKAICRRYEMCQNRLKELAGELYGKRKVYLKEILFIKEYLHNFRNLPQWCLDDIDSSIELIKDFRIAVENENNPKKFAEYTDETGRTAAFIGTGTAAGAAIATLGPSVAMSIATVLGTASTGTAISALSGVAATNAALAWLGGGAIAAGGSGVAGGTLLLGMFGPVGAAISAVSAISGLMLLKSKNQKKLAEIEDNIETIKHDIQLIEPKLNRLAELIARSDYHQRTRLHPKIDWMNKIFPKDYSQWDDENKNCLEQLVNAVSSTVQLINERI